MQRQKSARFVAVVLVTLILAAMALNIANIGILDMPLVGAVYVGNWRHLPFDSATWKSADGDVGPIFGRGPLWDNRRIGMLDDLLTRELHTGMSKTEVERLLGRSQCGSDTEKHYPLLAFPRIDQRIIAYMRFNTTSPFLVLKYRGTSPKLIGWVIK